MLSGATIAFSNLGAQHLTSMWSSGLLEHMQFFLEQLGIICDWVGQHCQYTALAFDVFEELFRCNVTWIYSHAAGYTLLAKAVEESSCPWTILLLNPVTSMQAGAPMIDTELHAWQESSSHHFGSHHAMESLLHPMMLLCDILFAAVAPPLGKAWYPYDASSGAASLHSKSGDKQTSKGERLVPVIATPAPAPLPSPTPAP